MNAMRVETLVIFVDVYVPGKRKVGVSRQSIFLNQNHTT